MDGARETEEEHWDGEGDRSARMVEVIQEATVEAIIEHALRGMAPPDPAWPVARLWERGEDSGASSVAGSGDLQVVGMVNLRLELRGADGQRVPRVFRLRLLRGG